MAEIKDLSASADKWKRVASGASAEYEDGIRNPRKNWQENTAAAAPAYDQGVQAAITRKSFAKGVNAAGNQKWQKNALEKGVPRWAQGIALAADAYAAGFSPYREVIARLTLPVRGPKGDPKNIDRVRVIAKALHEEKLKRQGAV